MGPSNDVQNIGIVNIPFTVISPNTCKSFSIILLLFLFLLIYKVNIKYEWWNGMESFDFEFDVDNDCKPDTLTEKYFDNELFSNSALVYEQCSRQGNL